MRHDRPASSGNQPRIFHYTVTEHYKAIVKDGVIRPATEGVPPDERPAVWFSIHPTWEPTATKALKDRKTGQAHRASWKEMQQLGPVRIEVGPDAAPHGWDDYLRLSGASVVTTRGLERAATRWGANALQWRVSFDPVPTQQWLEVEQWSGKGWEPIQRRSPMLWNDPTVAFITGTEEGWVRFREARVVIARDRRTGQSRIAFGRKEVERIRDGGNEKLQAFVVLYDPETDELERLAAACIALKGRHDLT